MKNAKGYTFLGWSNKPWQTTNPLYEAEEKIQVKGTMDLYATVFAHAREEDISADELPQINPAKFKQVIFVGDSRTAYMKNTLEAQAGGDVLKNVKFVCEVGKGLEWFRTTGYGKLYNLIKDGTTSILEKPTAVVFNLGINDLNNCSAYITYLNSMAPLFRSKGCKLYYMSVNPINREMLKVNGKKDRSEAEVRSFNARIQSGLGGNYTFIDTYSYLKAGGYGFDSGDGSIGSGGVDDGLHYTSKTYKRIYKYAMNAVHGR